MLFHSQDVCNVLCLHLCVVRLLLETIPFITGMFVWLWCLRDCDVYRTVMWCFSIAKVFQNGENKCQLKIIQFYARFPSLQGSLMQAQSFLISLCPQWCHTSPLNSDRYHVFNTVSPSSSLSSVLLTGVGDHVSPYLLISNSICINLCSSIFLYHTHKKRL